MQMVHITLDLANEALKDILSVNKTKIINSASIQDIVGRYFDIKIEEFKSKKRTRELSYPRQIAMFLMPRTNRYVSS